MLTTALNWLLAGGPLTVLAGFALAFLAVLLVLQKIKPDAPGLNLAGIRRKLGVEGLPVWLFLIAAAVWLVILVMLLAGVIMVLWAALFHPLPTDNDETWNFRFLLAQLAAVTTVLGVVVAFPVTLNRLRLASEDNETKLQGQITERINKAVENLGATRTSKSSHTPNLEVRIGAIYALERIAQDSPRDHVQIMEILTAYVRENATLDDAKESPHEVFERLTTGNEHRPPLSPEDAFKAHEFIRANPYGWNPTELDHRSLERWAREQLSPREDVQTTLRVIGRRSKSQIAMEQEVGFKMDLDRSNLQGAKLSGSFDDTSFSDARLDGATLNGTFRGAQFGFYGERAIGGASLQAARCQGIIATGADFSGANLNAAFFGGATLNKCRFLHSKLDHTNLNGAQVKMADFAFACPDHVYCYQEADFSFSRFYDTKLDEFMGILERPTRRLWIAGNVHMTAEQEDRFGREERPQGNEISNRKEWAVWRIAPDDYDLPQNRTG